MERVRAADHMLRKDADRSGGVGAQMAKQQVRGKEHEVQATCESPKVRVLCSNKPVMTEANFTRLMPPTASKLATSTHTPLLQMVGGSARAATPKTTVAVSRSTSLDPVPDDRPDVLDPREPAMSMALPHEMAPI